MRLPRASLLARLTAPDLAPVVLLEAPPGYGKSWLARRAAGADVLRLQGELGPLATTATLTGTRARRRCPPARSVDVDRLVERVEEADGSGRLIIAGRLLADAVHEVAQLVDGLILDTEALAVSAAEVDESSPAATGASTLASRLVEAADGNVRVDRHRARPEPARPGGRRRGHRRRT